MNNQKGFTTTSVLVAVGISAVIAFGAVTFLKNFAQGNKTFTDKSSRNEVMKLVELQFRGKTGCTPLISKTPGQNLEIDLQNQKFKAGGTFAGMEIKNFKYQNYLPVNTDGSSGIAEILISVAVKGESPITSTFPVPVKVTSLANPSVTGCDMGQVASFQELVDELCSKTYGAVSAGMSCGQVVAILKQLTTKSICDDLYGNPMKTKITGGHCDLSGVHLGKTCPGNKVISGFGANGEVVCKNAGTP